MLNEEKAYVVVSYDPEFIKRIKETPYGIKKVYFKQLSLKVPQGSTREHVAEILAGANSARVVENLQLKRVWMFTEKESEAMRFSYNKIEKEVRNLRINAGHTSLISEMLEEEYSPF